MLIDIVLQHRQLFVSALNMSYYDNAELQGDKLNEFEYCMPFLPKYLPYLPTIA